MTFGRDGAKQTTAQPGSFLDVSLKEGRYRWRTGTVGCPARGTQCNIGWAAHCLARGQPGRGQPTHGRPRQEMEGGNWVDECGRGSKGGVRPATGCLPHAATVAGCSAGLLMGSYATAALIVPASPKAALPVLRAGRPCWSHSCCSWAWRASTTSSFTLRDGAGEEQVGHGHAQLRSWRARRPGAAALRARRRCA